MDKKQIDSELHKYRQTRYIGLAILVIGALIFMSLLSSVKLFDLLTLTYVQVSLGVCFILMVVGVLVERRAYLHIKNVIAKEIAETVISQYVYDLVYDPKAPLIKSLIRDLYLALPAYDVINASDHIKGTYRGRSIEMADLRLLQEQKTDKDQVSLVTVFLGPLLKVEAPKKIANSLTISSNRMFVKDNIKTESVAFNKQFDIYCEDEHDAFYILTPQMMERISAFEKRMQTKVYLCFKEDGYLYCAINENCDRFELKLRQKNFDAISKSFDNDIRYVLGLIDDLLNMLEGQDESIAVN